MNFEFEHQQVETITLNDEPLFNPYDVGKCLDLKDRTIEKYLLEMDDNERCDLKSQMIECICDYCGKVVKKYPSQIKNRVFCNKECCDLDRKERANALNGSKG